MSDQTSDGEGARTTSVPWETVTDTKGRRAWTVIRRRVDYDPVDQPELHIGPLDDP